MKTILSTLNVTTNLTLCPNRELSLNTYWWKKTYILLFNLVCLQTNLAVHIRGDIPTPTTLQDHFTISFHFPPPPPPPNTGSVSPVHSINSTSTLTGEDSTDDSTSPDGQRPTFMLPITPDSSTSSSSNSSCEDKPDGLEETPEQVLR